MMRATILVLVIGIIFSACKKDKYTSAPQIKYKSLSSNVYVNTTQQGYVPPEINFTITDSEGDLGDTAFIHVKNLLSGRIDSFRFPELVGATKKNLKAEVSVWTISGCDGTIPPGGRIDTMYYEVYVTDFAKNKSNTIVTEDPVYQQCQ